MFVPANPAPQLVKITQAEPVGAIDDDRVRIGDVQAALDDRGREQHIGLAIDKFRHDFLQFITVHLTMADDHAGFREKTPQLLGHRVDGHYPVVQEEHLAAAI